MHKKKKKITKNKHPKLTEALYIWTVALLKTFTIGLLMYLLFF